MALIFGICLDAYLLHSLPLETLHLILFGLASAFASDILLQLVMLGILATRQVCYEMKSGKLPLDTVKLRLMTTAARNLATRVFSQYRE